MFKSYILILGDTYGHFYLINKAVRSVEKLLGFKIDYVFQTGNSGLFESTEIKKYINKQVFFDREVLMIHGNHDSEKLVNDLANKNKRIERLRVFKPGGEILHIRICGVGVDMMAVGGSPHNSNGVDYPYDEDDFLRSKKIWEDKGKPDIKFLLTHESPTGTGPIGNQFFDDPNAVGSEKLRELWRAVRPDCHFSGRYHTWSEYEEDGLRSLSIPSAHTSVCLLEITRYNSKFVYEFHRVDLSNLMMNVF